MGCRFQQHAGCKWLLSSCVRARMLCRWRRSDVGAKLTPGLQLHYAPSAHFSHTLPRLTLWLHGRHSHKLLLPLSQAPTSIRIHPLLFVIGALPVVDTHALTPEVSLSHARVPHARTCKHTTAWCAVCAISGNRGDTRTLAWACQGVLRRIC